MAGRKLKSFYYPALLVVLAGLVALVFWLVNPDMFKLMVSQFSAVFNPGGPSGATTIEMQPFLSPSGAFNIGVAWGNFTTSFFLMPWAPIPGFAFIALILLIIFYIKKRSEDKPLLFFFIWTAIMVIATLAQRRFAYYLVLNMAILSAYLGWQGIWWFAKRRYHTENPETLREQYKRSALVGILGGVLLFGLSFLITGTMYFFIPVFILGLLSVFYGFWAWVRLKNKNEYMILWAFIFPIGAVALALSKDETIKNRSVKKAAEPRKETLNPWLYSFNIVTLVLVVFVALFWPNWDKAKGVAAAATFAPTDAWEETLHWMKDNTPEPLPDGSYYALYDAPADSSFDYPETAYGVTAWWDYGYWITRTAHRIPSANPSQAPIPIRNVANLFLSTDQQKERDIVKTLNSSYIILDETIVTLKLWAVATWAGLDSDSFASVFYYQDENKQLVPVQVYDLDYYKLLCVRLFNFDGKASTSETPMIVTWENRTTSTGARIRLVTAAEEFSSYQAALKYVADNPNKNLYIAGSSPFKNPIPVEAVTDYREVFQSAQQIKLSDNTTTSSVKVFEYIGSK
jgi:asparagine N-glycosylation enzyme membrane subunit Stt3